MNKVLRIILIVVLVCIVGIIASYFVIRAYLTPDRVQTIAHRFASEAFHRPVTIGNVGVHIGFNIGIVVRDVSMPNTKGFSSTPLLEIDRATLVLGLLPLLRQQITIHDIKLTGVTLNLERNRQGALNFDITVPKEQRGPGWRLALSSISLSHATVVYNDKKAKTKMQLEDVRQHISFKQNHIQVSGRSTFRVASSDNLPELDVHLLNSIAYDPVRKHLDIKRLSVEYERASINVVGTIERMKDINATIEGDISNVATMATLIPEQVRPQKIGGSIRINAIARGTLEKLQLEGQCELKNAVVVPKDFNRGIEKITGTLSFAGNDIEKIAVRAAVGDLSLECSGAIKNIGKPNLDIEIKGQGDLSDLTNMTKDMEGILLKGPLSIDLTVQGDVEKPVYNGSYSIEQASIDGIGLAKPITQLTVRGNIKQDAADIKQCQGKIGSSDFAFNGRLTNFKKPVLQVTNNSENINLDELLVAQVEAEKGLPLTLEGTTVIQNLTGMDMEFKKINTHFRYENFAMDIRDCSAEAFDGTVLLDLHYDARNPEPYHLQTRLTRVSARHILKRLLKIESIEGRLSSEGEYRGSGFTQEEVKSNLTAHGTYALTSGSFKDFTLMTKLFAWLGMKDYSTVDVREMAGHFEIEKGQAKVENWALASSYGNFLANGTIGLNGAVNLDIVTTPQKKYSDIIRKYHAEWLLPIDEQGRATMDIKVTGTIESPSFSLDKSKIQERLKGKIIDDFEEKKKELEEKLKGLFGG